MHSKITVSSNKNEIKMNHVTNVLKIYPFDTAMTTHKTHNTDFTIRYVLICVKSAWQIITYIQFYELMFTESSQRITNVQFSSWLLLSNLLRIIPFLNLTSLYRLKTTICNASQNKIPQYQIISFTGILGIADKKCLNTKKLKWIIPICIFHVQRYMSHTQNYI